MPIEKLVEEGGEHDVKHASGKHYVGMPHVNSKIDELARQTFTKVQDADRASNGYFSLINRRILIGYADMYNALESLGIDVEKVIVRGRAGEEFDAFVYADVVRKALDKAAVEHSAKNAKK